MVGVADRRFCAGDEGNERQIPGNQMIDQPADIHPVARSRQAPLISLMRATMRCTPAMAASKSASG